jgi:hypothetical protein
MGGELIARAIVDGDATWKMFSPFALVWAGGSVGRAAHQAHYWSSRSSGRIAVRMALRREAKRLRAEPGMPKLPAMRKNAETPAAVAEPPADAAPALASAVPPEFDAGEMPRAAEPPSETMAALAELADTAGPRRKRRSRKKDPAVSGEETQQRGDDPPGRGV